MPVFQYRATSVGGGPQAGVVEAPDLDQAIDVVHRMGLTPIRLEAQTPTRATTVSKSPFQKRVTTRDLILFTRQLETMLESGLPILSSLDILYQQTAHPVLRVAIDRVRADVEQGSTLTEALRRYPRSFPPIFVNLVHAGEEGGLLGPMLDRIGGLLEYEEETEQRIKAATFYPMLIVGELGLAFLVLVKFVLPRFASLFRSLDAKLPLPTRVLIGTSDFFDHYWFLVITVAIGSAVGAVLWSRTERGRRRIDYWIISAPLFGSIFLKTIMSRFARVLAALVAAGIPILQALAVARGVAGNKIVEEEIDRMRNGVTAGMGLAESVQGRNVFPPLVVKMLAVGQETGAIDKMLVRVARYFDRDVDYAVKNLSTAIEPVLLVVLGAAVLFTALAVFLPLWNLMNAFRH
ncbi:MAG TPA: type II secretion system F family protein [Candidatus Limnocylindrales bacterium]|nr:type II secretion system F family protein [Candidatus Limnocylindrales bacterium]